MKECRLQQHYRKRLPSFHRKDSDIYRIAKKYLMKVKAVKEVEAYKEDSKEIFLGIDFSLKEALSGLDFAIYSFMEELEMNYI